MAGDQEEFRRIRTPAGYGHPSGIGRPDKGEDNVEERIRFVVQRMDEKHFRGLLHECAGSFREQSL